MSQLFTISVTQFLSNCHYFMQWSCNSKKKKKNICFHMYNIRWIQLVNDVNRQRKNTCNLIFGHKIIAPLQNTHFCKSDIAEIFFYLFFWLKRVHKLSGNPRPFLYVLEQIKMTRPHWARHKQLLRFHEAVYICVLPISKKEKEKKMVAYHF